MFLAGRSGKEARAMRAYERLIRYAAFETGSDDRSTTIPSNLNELTFADHLAEELRELGAEVVREKNGIVYASIPGNRKGEKTIGFIAHLDTVGDVAYQHVKPQVIEHYDGGDITLSNGESMSVSEYPALALHKGKTLIVTDGNTILGADDKAGVAEIVTLAERFKEDPSLPHGEIRIAFTPDEEIGNGTDFFDVETFGADYAFTLDGGEFGEVEYENFNASSAFLIFKGNNIHTGTAKGSMINASMLAMEFDSMIPQRERPEYTEGYEGFYHVTDLRGSVEQAVLRYILRDHDGAKLTEKKQVMEQAAKAINDKYGEGSCELELEDTYCNMATVIQKHPHLIENAFEAVRKAGGTPVSRPIRGGTDGARLSFMGLPTPNLGTGSGNHHSKKEYAVAEDMDKAVEMMLHLAASYCEAD